MMDSAYTTSIYNIEATLANWVAVTVATYAPVLAAGATFVLEGDEKPLTTPVFAVGFPSLLNEYGYTGRIVANNERGGMNLGMMRVVMYASRGNPAWRAQLNQMTDAVRKGFYSLSAGAVIIKDFSTTPNAPTNTAQRVTLTSINQTSFPVSLNPDVEGAAVFITYRYIERVQV